MSQKRTVHLYGALTQFSPDPIEIAVDDFRDVISALKSRFPAFRPFIIANPMYGVVLTDEANEKPRAVEPEFISAPFGEDVGHIHIFPETIGEVDGGVTEVAWIAAAATAVGISYGAMYLIVQIAAGIILNIVLAALSPKPNAGANTGAAAVASFIFNGPINVNEQGYQVPIVYGIHMTGSVVVSAGISVEKIAIAPTVPPAPSNPSVIAPAPWQDSGNGGSSDGGY